MKIAIVGAGISGLTAALALYEQGLKDVQIYERAAKLTEMGAGIQLAPNAVRLLYQLGLASRLESVAQRAAFGELRRAIDNRVLAVLPYADYFQRHYGLPCFQLLRTELHELLLAAVQERQIAVHLDRELLETRQPDQKVKAFFSDGSEQTVDLLIGADGVSSALAAQIFPGQPPRYSGFACWRALIDQKNTGSQPVNQVTVWAAQDRHLVAYPAGPAKQLNLVATIRHEQWQYSGRVAPSEKEAWLRAFDGCCEDVFALIECAPPSDLWGFFEQKNLPCWHKGHQVLIGDAAHAMLPNLAQGAAQGMEDGVVLARLLAEAPYPSGIESTLTSFYRQRRSRIKKVQDGARWNLNFFHRQKSPLTAFRDNLMRLGGPLTTELIGRKYHWLYSRSQ